MPVFVLCFLSQSYDLEFWSMTVIDFVCTCGGHFVRKLYFSSSEQNVHLYTSHTHTHTHTHTHCARSTCSGTSVIGHLTSPTFSPS